MASIEVLNVEQEPITLDEAKQFLLVDFNHDDAQIIRLVSGVRQELEAVLGRSLAPQTVQYTDIPDSSRWSTTRRSYILLPRPPFKALVSLEVFDGEKWEQKTPADYQVIPDEPARLLFAPGSAPYRATYTCGYEVGKLPGQYLQAIYELLTYRYQNREGGAIPPSILSGLFPGKVWL